MFRLSVFQWFSSPPRCKFDCVCVWERERECLVLSLLKTCVGSGSKTCCKAFFGWLIALWNISTVLVLAQSWNEYFQSCACVEYTGFVGSHLVDRLMEAGHFVIVADNFFTVGLKTKAILSTISISESLPFLNLLCLSEWMNEIQGSKYTLTRWLNHPRFELIRHDITEPLLLEVDKSSSA